MYENNSNQFERIVVPFTDGIKTTNIVTYLEKAYHTEGATLIDDFEKNITLAILDEAWKKHLRKMDELKQSVQLAVHEQKDPLLIYKFEAFELFRTTLGEINQDVISFLSKADLPVQNQPVQEAPEVENRKESYETSKEEVLNTEELAERNRQAGQSASAATEVQEPVVRDAPKINRNDNVIIKNFSTGETQTMKYKKAEALLETGEWVIMEAQK